MKKIKYIVLSCCLLMLSGCVKNYNTMTIKNDKSMVYESEILIADELKDSMTESFDRESYENAGFTISEAKEDKYSGYKFTKKYSNIDNYSNDKGAVVSISDMLEGKFEDKILFKVEKGFLKNTYTATFKYEVNSEEYTNDNTIDIEDTTETNDDNLEEETTENTDEDNIETNEITDETTDETTDEDSGDLSDLGNLMGLANEMEFNYKLVLPSKSISNNATNVSEDGKTLTWNLIADGESDINFSFSLLNLTNILILGGGAILLIIIIIVVIIVVKNKKSQKDTLIHTDYDSSIMNNVNNIVIQENVQTPNQVSESPINNQNVIPQTQMNNQNVVSQPSANTENVVPQVQVQPQGPMPANNSLEITLPSEETQNQVNVVQKEAMFVTKNNEYVEEVKETQHNDTIVEMPNATDLTDNRNLQK